MRKLLLILFVAMLPLQWSSAAVAALCLHGAGTGAKQAASHLRIAAGAAAQAGAATTDHAGHALAAQGPGHDAKAAHHLHGAAGHAHDDGGALHPDCGGCCHATCSALPTRTLRPQAVTTPQSPQPQAALPIRSPTPEGPFRPPRSALA